MTIETRDKHARRRSFLTIFVVVLLAFVVASCDVPFSDDSPVDAPTPVPTAGDIPDQPEVTDDDSEQTPQAVEESRNDGWTVITGPERVDPPGDRSSDQVFTMAGASDAPATIDPALVRDTESAFLARQVFRGLIRLDSDLEPVPDLAQQVEISPDGRLYRFQLHDEITFHDGTEITAQHVKDSLERATDPALTGGDGDALPSRNYLDDIVGARDRMDGLREDIPGIQVIDERTLEIELDRGVVDFLERLTNPSTLIVDTGRAEFDDDWWQDPNGSGPFRLAEWDADRQVTLQAHDGYVVPPELAEVHYRVGAEAVGQMQLYETGQIDLVGVPLSVLDRIQYAGSPIEGELREELLLSTSFLIINQEHPPFDQQALREALIRTFPRDQMVEAMLDGRVRLAQGIVPPEMDVGEIDAFPYSHDPALARELAAQIDPGAFELPFTIYTSGGSIPVALKHFIEQELDQPVEVVQLRWTDYMADMDEGRLSVFILSWVADGPDPVSFLRALFHSDSPDNYGRYSDAQVDDLLDQAAVEQDDSVRAEMLMEAHRIVLESAVVLPLYHSVDYLLVADHVRGLETTPMGILGLETVWIER